MEYFDIILPYSYVLKIDKGVHTHIRCNVQYSKQNICIAPYNECDIQP